MWIKIKISINSSDKKIKKQMRIIPLAQEVESAAYRPHRFLYQPISPKLQKKSSHKKYITMKLVEYQKEKKEKNRDDPI